jgi:hypothetical protein
MEGSSWDPVVRLKGFIARELEKKAATAIDGG